MRKSRKKRQSGSLTIEAIISFTVFLAVSFLMLNLVKLTMISLVLENATSETAKQIATSCYPIVIVNSLQSEGETKIQETMDAVLGTGGATLSSLVDSKTNGTLGELMGLDTSGSTDVVSMVRQLMSNGENYILKQFADFKGKIGIKMAAGMLNNYLESSGMNFDKDKVVFRIVKFPQTNGEFNAVGDYEIKGDSDNLVIKAASEPEALDGSYNRDDVVICAEYDYKIALPMLPSVKLKLRSVAVEHAWLHGCLVQTSREEGLELATRDLVYVTTGGYGEKYHREGCPRMTANGQGYKTSGISRADAVGRGLTPCKVCNP